MPNRKPNSLPRRILMIVLVVVSLVAIALAITAYIVLHRASPILKGRVIQTLETYFHGNVELGTFEVSILNGLDVSGTNLRIYAPDDVVAAGATAPIITVGNFAFHADIRALLEHPTRIHSVRVSGLEVRIPPRQQRNAAPRTEKKPHRIEIAADEIEFTDSRLIIVNGNPNKPDKDFELKHILLKNFGPGSPSNYEATLTNAIPKGEIHTTGTFGPWNAESPGDSPVTGIYRFDHADLNTIKGIGGILNSTGKFSGQLNHIVADGTAHVPDFTLDSANHPMPLTTAFHVIVDGLTGDTYLQPVQATLGRSNFTCTGSVVNIKGVGHTIDLDIHVPAGHLEDFLQLAVKTRPPVMTATLGMNTHLHIRPGKDSVTHKLSLEKGTFSMSNIHFTNPKTQDKVDELSARASARPEDAHPGADDVLSHMTGTFTLGAAKLTIPTLDYRLPGATAHLTGVYSLDGEQFEFAGKVRTDARVSQMIKPGWKSTLLKLADPFFAKNGAGAEIPVKISGTKEAPHFGLDFGSKTEKRLEGAKR
ncbi:hypothetical protein SAMN05421771_1954 [Granulicella pectinivorans]|uniref:AsmA-like C-terminal region n=1 Tax=Granulicella pectinivorans TaxID=474950 RepID=A0A1I6M780_9BACT|nr:hypothetical protein [Granulicella pectinivorans]SFS11372.1 hypothetical protein SAMN05421771_1954 [Granulicella pectinivorans]